MFVTARGTLSFVLVLVVVMNWAQDVSARRRGRCPRRRIMEKSGLSGTIQTPKYPNPYTPRQICLWRIKVPRGYTVHFDFHDRFGVFCNMSKDRIAVSTRRLYFNSRPRGSQTTAMFCGVSQIPNVTAPVREIWVRFQAHRQPTGGIGFRATYTALDINECDEGHGCQHDCINTPGSYRCSCNLGFTLAKNGFNCTAIPEYKVKFEKSRYEADISKITPKYSKVMTLKAFVEREDIPLKYRFIRRYPKPSRIPEYPFRISPRTGVITTRRRLPVDIKEYQVTVQAEVNERSSAEVTVYFKVRDPPSDNKKIQFSKPHYSVIITNDLKPNRTVLHLSVTSPTASYHVTYSISEKTRYFAVDKDTGRLRIKNDLSELKIRGNLSRSFEFTVVARHRQRKDFTASTSIKVIVIPAYSGDTYRFVEKRSHDKARGTTREKTTKPSEFSFHRFFRQLSPVARNISRAEQDFSRMIQDVRESVIRAYTDDQRLRSSGPVIANLDTISLTSPDKLEKIINESKCVLPAADCSNQEYNSIYRTFDGTCNNLENPLWGAANMPYNRLIGARYWDEERRGEPVGFPDQEFPPPLPSPHLVSERYVIHRQHEGRSKNKFSHMMMQWGQFLDHDITFTAESEGSEKCALPRCDGSSRDYESPCFPIMYPPKSGKSAECTMFTRSAAACQTDPKNIKPREQLNLITSYIDGSQIYGSSLEQANSLRELEGDRGFLKLDPKEHLLPELKDTLNPPLNLCEFSGGCFAAGDLRANEQIVLASMHTMWAREHNRLALFLKHNNPHWDSEKLFQEARKIVIAELQHITYNEYLTKLLGKDAIPPYSGYKEDIDATVFNSFATSAFRAGHSMVRPSFAQLDGNFDPIGPEIPLMQAFFNNKYIRKEGIEPFILGLLANASETIDRGMAVGLTKHLFQQPGTTHGFDLAALNIQRGRDHGLPGYGGWRRECGLSEAPFFEETEYEIKNAKARNVLAELYDGVEHSDLWVAGLAEDHVKGAMVGPTFHCILKRQFLRLRDGDRFWYEKDGVFTKEQLDEIRKVTLSKVICDNLVGVISVQKDAFVAVTNERQRVGCFYDIPTVNMSKWKEGVDVQAQSTGQWSEWIRTTKTNTGSWGPFNRPKICGNNSVITIECNTTDGRDADSLDETFTCNKKIGFYCRNVDQEGNKPCGDYKFRVLCSLKEKAVAEKKAEVTGFPSVGVENHLQVDPKLKSRFPVINNLATTVSKEITLYSKHKSQPGAEYLYLGRDSNSDKHRFLIQFDLRRVNRRYNLLGAYLQLFLVSGGDASEQLKHSLEVYPITSTDWDESNVTAVIPWNEDFLGINSDVDKKSIGRSDTIRSKDRLEWITINVLKTVYNWRVARRPKENYGFMVKLANEQQAQSLMYFTSSVHKTAAIRPKLSVLLYSPPW